MTTRASTRWALAALLGCWLAAPARAQSTMEWQPTLEAAQRVAAQTNRMVLVHFYADWCAPCKCMEREVLSQPQLGEALASDYVAVKINADHRPATAQQYGVSALPTDVILTPQGQMIERLAGAADLRQYVTKLGRISAAYRQEAAAMLAQGPGAPPAAPAYAPPAAVNTAPGFAPPGYAPPSAPVAAAQTPSGYGYPPPAMAAQGVPPGPQLSAGQPAYAAQIDPIAPDYGAVQNAAPPAWSAAPTAPAFATQAAPPSYSAASSYTALPQPMAGPPSFAPPAVAPSGNDLELRLPPGSPPLALDGYSAVQLGDNGCWVRGNDQWGVIHRGRTYLFTSPEEQQRFYADPDRYAPVLSGNDIVMALEQNQTEPGQRTFGAWFNKRVYLFSNEQTLQKFSADPHRYVQELESRESATASGPPAAAGDPAARMGSAMRPPLGRY